MVKFKVIMTWPQISENGKASAIIHDCILHFLQHSLGIRTLTNGTLGLNLPIIDPNNFTKIFDVNTKTNVI